uniref:Beta-lactamase family protein n=1 Tax=Babesia bovis TaxID=5865 RepID=A7ANN9_BABBO|eukprot:XP_001611741.1 beta-lactamase family protein [Babesia bovis T2Bo]
MATNDDKYTGSNRVVRTESVKSDNGDNGRTHFQRSMDVVLAISNLTFEWNRKLFMGSFVSTGHKKQYWKDSHHDMAQLIVEKIRNLKGCWVKVGQILSTKPGLLPKCYVDAFSQLHDQVGHSDFAEVIDIIEEEIGYMDEVFNNFDSIPLASASIAQVHKAKLHDGNPVAIKVQHKCSERNMRNDLEILKMILFVAQSVGHYKRMFASIDDYTAAAMKEVDFTSEADNCKRAAIDAKVSGIPICIPKIFDRYCSRRVVTMELFELYKMTDASFYEKHNIDPWVVVYDIHDFAIFQILSVGHFHGDPHPGNLLLTQNNDDGKFYPVLIDWGMTQSLTTKQRVGLCNLNLALCMADTIGCFTGFVEAGFDMTTHETLCYEQFLESLVNIFASDFNKVMDFCDEEGSMKSMNDTSAPGELHHNGLFIREFITNAPNFFPILLKVISEYRNYAIVLQTQVPFMQILYKNAGNALYNMYSSPLSHILSSEASKAVFMRKIRRLKQLLANDCVDVTETQLLKHLFSRFNGGEKHNSKLTGTAAFRKPVSVLESRISGLLHYIAKDSSLIVAAQVVVIQGNNVDVDLSYGFMGQYECRPINSTALFQISNLMNGLVATAVLHLIGNSDMDIDDPIAKYWPEFGQNGKKSITIRSVLNHSSGLLLPYPRILMIENIDYDTMVRDIAQCEFHKEVMDQTQYGYLYFGWIMAELIRRVSGKSIEEYILMMAASIKVPMKQLIFPCIDGGVAAYMQHSNDENANPDDAVPDAANQTINATHDSGDPVPRVEATSSAHASTDTSYDLPRRSNSFVPTGGPPARNTEGSRSLDSEGVILDITFDRPQCNGDFGALGLSNNISLNNGGFNEHYSDQRLSLESALTYESHIKAKAKSLVMATNADDSSLSMETMTIDGRTIESKRVLLPAAQPEELTSCERTETVSTCSLEQPDTDCTLAEPDTSALDVTDLLISQEEFEALPDTPTTMPSPSINISKAKRMPSELQRGFVKRFLASFENVVDKETHDDSTDICLCGINSEDDEQFYNRCFSPSERCPLATRLVRASRLPYTDLDDIDFTQAEKILNPIRDIGTKKRYHPILVSEEHVISNDDELADLDLVSDDIVVTRTRLRKFIMKRPVRDADYHYCNYDVINHRCIITDCLTMDYPSMYSKSIPCLNGRASAMALAMFYKGILDNSLVSRELVAEALSTVSLDCSVLTKMLTALYTPVWGLGYQLFYMRRRCDDKALVGLGCVDISGSLNLVVPDIELVVTILFSCGTGYDPGSLWPGSALYQC